MKKFAVILTAVVTLTSSAAFAQPTGRGATAARNTASNDFAWGIGLGGLAVLATVVGLTASAASSTPSTFSH